MIFVNMRGNLGNQLFTYSFAKKIQETTNQKICINYYNLKKYRPDYTLSINKYVLNSNVIYDCTKPLPWFINQYFILTRIVRKIMPNIYFNIMKLFGCYAWLGNNYKKIRINKHRNYYVDGYFQCDRYFSDIKDELLKDLTPKEKPNKENDDLYDKIINSESVCVTIRRGDYVTNEKYKKEFFICDEEYFLNGISTINKIKPNCKLFIFSDDIEWAKNNLKFNNEVYFESGKDSVCEKLRLMSACKYFIISNSSFSWWAQYMSKNENKIVIAPRIWKADGSTGDIYQDNWILI